VSVYLSVSPPDGFIRWGQPEWDRWLQEHPWEAAERVCSRGDWAAFLYQIRLHADRARKLLEPHLDALVNERPLDRQAAEDLQLALQQAREELAKKPAETLRQGNNHFVSDDDMTDLIALARERVKGEPTAADVWGEVFEQVEKVLAKALAQKRGIYFGNV
jgi:hypothetical protein